jgi:hypothetical protein
MLDYRHFAVTSMSCEQRQIVDRFAIASELLPVNVDPLPFVLHIAQSRGMHVTDIYEMRESVMIDYAEFHQGEAIRFCSSTPCSSQRLVSAHDPLSELDDLFVPLHEGPAVEAHGLFAQLPHTNLVRQI